MFLRLPVAPLLVNFIRTHLQVQTCRYIRDSEIIDSTIYDDKALLGWLLARLLTSSENQLLSLLYLSEKTLSQVCSNAECFSSRQRPAYLIERSPAVAAFNNFKP